MPYSKSERLQFGFIQAPARDERVDLHFVAFVHHKGSLYELGNYIFMFVLLMHGEC